MTEKLESRIKDILKRTEFWAWTPAALYLLPWLQEMGRVEKSRENLPEFAFVTSKLLMVMATGGFGSILVRNALERRQRKKNKEAYIQRKKIDLQNLPKKEIGMWSFIDNTITGSIAYSLRFYDSAKEAMDKAEEANPESVFPSLTKADLCMKKHDLDGTFINLRSSLRAYKRAERKMGWLTNYSIGERTRANPFRPEDPLNFLTAALCSYFFKREDRALDALHRAVELSEGSSDYQLFAAELLEEIIDSGEFVRKEWFELRDSFWKRAASTINREAIEQHGETKNKVYKLKGDKFAEESFILKEGSPKDIQSEMATTLIMKGLVEQYKGYFVSTPVATLSDGRLCVIRREPGKNLLEIIREKGDFQRLMPTIVDMLAIIHAQFPEECAGEREDIRKAVEKKLDATKTSTAVKRLISDGYEPIERVLEGAHFVYNKDAHPENWRYGDNGQIGVLDCEKTRQIPQGCDLANLFDYRIYLEPEERDTLISRYLDRFNQESSAPVEDEKDFRLQYHTSRIHRAVSLNAAMQDRASREEERAHILLNAKDAIIKIEQEHREHYEAHRAKYNDLEQGLLGLVV